MKILKIINWFKIRINLIGFVWKVIVIKGVDYFKILVLLIEWVIRWIFVIWLFKSWEMEIRNYMLIVFFIWIKIKDK